MPENIKKILFIEIVRWLGMVTLADIVWNYILVPKFNLPVFGWIEVAAILSVIGWAFAPQSDDQKLLRNYK